MKKNYFITFLLLLSYHNFTYGQTYVKEFHSISQLITVNNEAYFVASTADTGNELWKTNGSSEGTHLVKDINTFGNGDPSKLTQFRGEIYFEANDGVFSRVLWKTDGTEVGTVKVLNDKEANGLIGGPSNFIEFKNEFYFTSGNGRKLWRTSSFLSNEIELVYDAGFGNMGRLRIANDTLYFSLNNQLWQTDGTAIGTNEVDIDENPRISHILSLNDDLYVVTHTSNNDNMRLYCIKNNNQIELLKDFSDASFIDANIYNITAINNEVYFSITTGNSSSNYADALWKTNGTPSGTNSIKSFGWARHSSGSNISNFVEYKDILYFNGGSQNNFVLWKSDGTTSGTLKALDARIDNSVRMFVHKNLLYYSLGGSLTSTDGISETSKVFSTLKISSKNSNDLFNIAHGDDLIYLEVTKSNFKRELYTSAPSPILEVKPSNRVITNKAKLNFETKIDSVETVAVRIVNNGNKSLSFSKIQVTGEDFYIDGKQDYNISIDNPEGNFPKHIKPNERFEFNVSYFPHAKGLKKGGLSILSNDKIHPNFSLNLIGHADDEIGQNLTTSIPLDKEINFNHDSKIVLSNAIIDENSSSNASIGMLTVPSSANQQTFQFVAIDNATDNQFFTIADNELKANISFDFESRNTYVLRIKAVNGATGEEIEDDVLVQIQDVLEAVTTPPCPTEQVDLAFGLDDVKFINEQSLVAIGTQGTIIKSDDAGNTWRLTKSNLYKHLEHLQFTSANTGYVVGQNILKTEDGGESWFPLELLHAENTTHSLTNLYFLNANLGFVTTRDGKILKTVDGGRYWKLTRISGENLSSVYFINESVGFVTAFSKAVYKTIDGGETWENVALDFPEIGFSTDFIKIEFVTDTVGFLISQQGDVLKTLDGGNTWNYITKIVSSDINNVVLVDENEGYLLTNQVFKTLDGGETWTEETSGNNGVIHAMAINEAGKKVTVGRAAGCCIGFTTGSVIRTKNLTDDWETKSYIYPDSRGFFALDMQGKNGYVFSNFISGRTTDGGITWEKMNSPEDSMLQLEVFGNTMYALGNTEFYKSTDKGDSWSIVGDGGHLRNMYFLNEQVILANGENQGIYKSTDSGNNWVNVSSVNHFGFDFFFKNNNEGYSVGLFGSYKTMDGGDTWEQFVISAPDFPGNSTYSIGFFGDLGYAGHEDGLYKSTDAGLTWARTSSNIGGIVRYVHPISELEWLIGTEDKIFRSRDGGLTWNLEYHDNEINDVHFDNGVLYLAGYRNLTSIGKENSPKTVGNIEGDLVVSSASTEGYSIITEPNVKYTWTVTGNNDITYNLNEATITWNNPGTYTITVSPENNCGTGIPKTQTVVVEEPWQPAIIGDTNVSEFSLNNEYFTALDSDSRYSWFVEGDTNNMSTNNSITIDWDKEGIGNIEVIETRNSSGNRKSATLKVTIGTALGVDDFEDSDRMTVFPNPTSTSIGLKLDNRISFSTGQFELIDLTGRVYMSKTFQNNGDLLDFNIDRVPVGIYIVQLKIDNRRLTKKIIKI